MIFKRTRQVGFVYCSVVISAVAVHDSWSCLHKSWCLLLETGGAIIVQLYCIVEIVLLYWRPMGQVIEKKDAKGKRRKKRQWLGFSLGKPC